MILIRSAVFMSSLCTVASCLAQMPLPANILVETTNEVIYVNDVATYSATAATPTVQTTITPARQFAVFMEIGDIVSVNGQPAKGYRVIWGRSLYLRTSPAAGQSPADVDRTNILQEYYEILQPDGTVVGTIVGSGVGGGIPQPGAPSIPEVVYTGGTGAYSGIRGRSADSVALSPLRFASASEDPAARRTLGGGHATRVLQLNPESHMHLVSVMHADLSMVTEANPAHAGESLVAIASGLGGTLPALVRGASPASPWPVSMAVNDEPAPVTAQVSGWAGLADVFRIDFTLPNDLQAGSAAVVMSAAYLPLPALKISVK